MCNEDKRELAFKIVDVFEELLQSKGIFVPSDDREGNPEEGSLYGCEYYDLVDSVACILNGEEI